MLRRQERTTAPALVLLNVNPFMWTNGSKFSLCHRHDDVTKDGAAKRQHSREPAALRVAAAISDLERAGRQLGSTAGGQHKGRQHQTDDRAWQSPQHLDELEPAHDGDA